MFLFLNASMAAREMAFDEDPSGGTLWGKPNALDNLVRTIASGLEADPVMGEGKATSARRRRT
jgi:hypothetical protein